MIFDKINEETLILQRENEDLLFSDAQSALDVIGEIWGIGNYTQLILMKEDICEEFFDLKTKIAGDVLQKFINYGFHITIVGDFSQYTRESLKDFIRESNKGKKIWFTNSREDAIRRLS